MSGHTNKKGGGIVYQGGGGGYETNMTAEVSISLVITSTEAELETPPPRGTEPTTTALKLGIKSGAWKLATTPCNKRYHFTRVLQ